MQLFVTILHVMLSFTLIGIILLQPGKDGASVLGGGGGGGNQMYGPRGQGNLLGRATTVIAGLFMVTSITLAWYSGDRGTSGTELENAIQEFEAGEAGADVVLPTAPAAPPPWEKKPERPTEAAPEPSAPSGDAPASGDEGGALTDPNNAD